VCVFSASFSPYFYPHMPFSFNQPLPVSSNTNEGRYQWPPSPISFHTGPPGGLSAAPGFVIILFHLSGWLHNEMYASFYIFLCYGNVLFFFTGWAKVYAMYSLLLY